MMSYQNPPSNDDDETAVPLITTNLPSTTTTTMGHRSLVWIMVAIVLGVKMLVVAGGAVWMLKTNDAGLTTTAVGGLVIATLADTPCLPASDTFSGISETDFGWFSAGQKDPFETCYQEGDYAKYCWSHSRYHINKNYFGFESGAWFECLPLGRYWHSVDPKYVNPVTHPYSCGPPCQEMHHSPN